jgi:hypothetical protein
MAELYVGHAPGTQIKNAAYFEQATISVLLVVPPPVPPQHLSAAVGTRVDLLRRACKVRQGAPRTCLMPVLYQNMYGTYRPGLRRWL